MDNSVYFRRITDFADLHFQVEQLFKAVHVDGQGRAIGKVIYEGVYFAEIYCRSEYFFHCLYANKYAEHRCRTYVSAVGSVVTWGDAQFRLNNHNYSGGCRKLSRPQPVTVQEYSVFMQAGL